MTPCSLVNGYQLLGKKNRYPKCYYLSRRINSVEIQMMEILSEKLQVQNSFFKKKTHTQCCGRCGSIAQVGFSAVRRAMFIATVSLCCIILRFF